MAQGKKAARSALRKALLVRKTAPFEFNGHTFHAKEPSAGALRGLDDVEQIAEFIAGHLVDEDGEPIFEQVEDALELGVSVVGDLFQAMINAVKGEEGNG